SPRSVLLPLPSTPMLPRPPRTTLFPCTTLFRSVPQRLVGLRDGAVALHAGVVDEHVHPAERLHHPGERSLDLGGLRHVAAEEARSEEHTSELQSRENLVCRLLLETKKVLRPCLM